MGTPALAYLPSYEINNDLFYSRAFAGMSGLHPPPPLAELGLVSPPSTSPSPPAVTGPGQAEFGPAEGQRSKIFFSSQLLAKYFF